MMKKISPEKMGELMCKAKALKYGELFPVYMTAMIMAEADVSPAEMVAYIEENFVDI